MKKILVTGSGGIGGVNFVRALRVIDEKFFIVGTDFNQYHLEFPDVDIRVRTPRHSDPQFIPLIKKIISEHSIDFIHPQPSSESLVISEDTELKQKTFLPNSSIISYDKLTTQKTLFKNNIPVAITKTLSSIDELQSCFEKFGGGPLWIRSKKGAGGNLSLLCKNHEEAKCWINLWIMKNNAVLDDFMIQEYLPGRNIAWDSFWHEGKLIASYSRERIEYPFKHISPSGITGTPTVSKIIVDENINKLSESAIKCIDEKPHGNYAVDLKGDQNNKMNITEIDSGKFHTTTPLWGYISSKIFKQNPLFNLPYLYVKLGLGEITEPKILGNDIYPDQTTLLRHIDCGDWILKKDGSKVQVL
jgi:carbamoyl-phosphate synthase large subunit